MFNQTFTSHDLFVIGILVVLEGVLSIDNALVLGLLAKRVPKRMQGRALTYGLVGAFVFRLIAIASAQMLLRWRIVKLLGGGYLIWVAGKYFLTELNESSDETIVEGEDHQPEAVEGSTGHPLSEGQSDVGLDARNPLPVSSSALRPTPPDGKAGFWPTVAVIELTDIAFAIDSILAAIALVGPMPEGVTGLHPKLWVVVTGGMLGVLLMRVAAVIFIRLLERFPRFETAAYLLVLVIGGKLCFDWWFNTADDPHRLDFHSYKSLAFWVFWLLMLASFLIGFIPKKKHSSAHSTT